MKSLILISVLFSFHIHKTSFTTSSAQFTKATGTSNKQSDSTIAREWKLLPVLPSDTAAGKIPSINFNLNEHRFYGNTGCNSMSGTFLFSGGKLVFNRDFMTTKMSCPGYNEKAFMDNLIKTNGYKIKDGVLEMMKDNTILSKWVRKERSIVPQKT